MDLDEGLLHAVDAEALHNRTSRNQFIIQTLSTALKLRERRRIDEAFEQMAKDPDYLRQLEDLEKELAPASDAVWDFIDGPGRSRIPPP